MGARLSLAKEKARRVAVMALAILALAVITATVSAQTGGGYDLTWYTIDGGGETVSGGGYTLVGTVGQADAAQVSGGGYVLQGGFWSGGIHTIFLPLILR